ncbi:MAG: ATP-binding cassette domain-containing protein [Candidatus Eremiobacteraeota bacterium]|nr:ATP-binding cassette domain-containing protein [Candidatus Eremiobacteraeota bacterium]
MAVDDVDLHLEAGEIHALVGENGAGKSTLASIAARELKPDGGSVESSGTVGLVHQHFELIGRLRVWQNVLLGREPRRGWRIDLATARKRVHELAQSNGLQIDVDAFVGDLPIGVQQRVELLRELDRNPAILLLDEPTAALAPSEIAAFFETIRSLAARDTAVMIVTHKLQDVIEYSTRVSVMRAGKIVETVRTAETTLTEIARAMVGGNLPRIAARTQHQYRACVRIEHLHAGTGGAAASDINLDVRAGEIVGIAGVEGNGQSAIADALCGTIPYDGTIERPAMGAIPQDRQREALVLPWSLVQNAMLGRQRGRSGKRVILDKTGARSDAAWIASNFDVRATSLNAPVRTLSGGNQQKFVVGRALIDRPPFVLAYNPSRGVDVGAAALVQSRLMQARNDGAAILLISFELDEIFELADRIAVMYRGKIVAIFERKDAQRASIGRMMAGGS